MIAHYQLSSGSSLVLPTPRCVTGDPLLVVVGGGRGCVLRAEAPLGGLWIPLRGRLQLGSPGGNDGALVPGDLRVTESESGLQAVGRGNALWLAVLGARSTWQRMLDGRSEMPLLDPLLLPAWHRADHGLRRQAIALVRVASGGDAAAATAALLENVCALQAQLASAIERCPGRTYAQRRQVFLRLQRVRNYLAANCHLELDNDALARMASYSPWHFIRAFRAAYRQTPHAYLVDQRLQRARRLLRSSPLAIAEIALASGFENRCAFSRLFRQRFGMPAGALRRLGAAAAVPIAQRA